MILLYRPHSQDCPSPSSIILCHSTEKNKWVLLSLFSSLAFVHGYIDGVSLSISMIWFSLSGGASRGKEGNGECEGMVLRFTGPSKGRNERGEMIFTTTKRKKKRKKKNLTARLPIVIRSGEKPSTEGARKQLVCYLFFSPSHSAMIPLGFSSHRYILSVLYIKGVV